MGLLRLFLWKNAFWKLFKTIHNYTSDCMNISVYKKRYEDKLNAYFEKHPEEKRYKNLYRLKLNSDKHFLERKAQRTKYSKSTMKIGTLLGSGKHGYVFYYRKSVLKPSEPSKGAFSQKQLKKP